MPSIYDFDITLNTKKTHRMREWRDNTLLLVNTASECGFTRQYTSLESLHQRYYKHGLRILGFPCNQFGAQEPGEDEDIQLFCQTKYDVTFPISTKIHVNGESTHPIFDSLKRQAPGILGSKKIKWNFTKFLVEPDEKRIYRYSPVTKPEALEKQIQQSLQI